MSAGTREGRWWGPEVAFAVAQSGWQVWSREKWVGAVVHAWNPRSWGAHYQPGLCNKAVSTWRWRDLRGWLAAEQGCGHIGAKGAPNGRNSEVGCQCKPCPSVGILAVFPWGAGHALLGFPRKLKSNAMKISSGFFLKHCVNSVVGGESRPVPSP